MDHVNIVNKYIFKDKLYTLKSRSVLNFSPGTRSASTNTHTHAHTR